MRIARITAAAVSSASASSLSLLRFEQFTSEPWATPLDCDFEMLKLSGPVIRAESYVDLAFSHGFALWHALCLAFGRGHNAGAHAGRSGGRVLCRRSGDRSLDLRRWPIRLGCLFRHLAAPARIGTDDRHSCRVVHSRRSRKNLAHHLRLGRCWLSRYFLGRAFGDDNECRHTVARPHSALVSPDVGHVLELRFHILPRRIQALCGLFRS
jgi:hypothetical protein